MMGDMMAPMWMMWLFWLLMTGLIIGGVILAVRAIAHRPSSDQSDSTNNRHTAFQVLDERFARGEIDEREYRERLRTLQTGAAETGEP